MGSNSSTNGNIIGDWSSSSSSNCNCYTLTPEEAQRFERMLHHRQPPLLHCRQRCKTILLRGGGGTTTVALLVVVVVVAVFFLMLHIGGRTKINNQQPSSLVLLAPLEAGSLLIPLKLPSDLSVQSTGGALAMNFNGSVLAIGDPRMREEFGMKNGNESDPRAPYRGRIIMLQEQQHHQPPQHDESGVLLLQEGDVAAAAVEPSSYRSVQILEADDSSEAFGTVLAMSSSTNVLVVGIPCNTGDACMDGIPAVLVYGVEYNQLTADKDDYRWDEVDVIGSESSSNNDMTGAWVAISDDGSRFVYSAPNHQPNPGAVDYDVPKKTKDKDDVVNRGRHQYDPFFNPPSGTVILWHQKNVQLSDDIEQQFLLRGTCKFGQTVSVSSSSADRPVVVITQAGCYNNNGVKDKQRKITVWENYNGRQVSTDLLVPNEPTDSPNSPDCAMSETGTAATVSNDGNRIVVLAACLDQETYQVRQAIFTFEKDPKSHTWVERVSSPTLIVDTDMPQYHMSSFAFDDDAKTVVLTTAGESDPRGGGHDLVCYKWNEATVSWYESWRKVGTEANRVALSGNGKRLAVMGYCTDTNMMPQLAVYNLP
jgi:hypothetical protein